MIRNKSIVMSLFCLLALCSSKKESSVSQGSGTLHFVANGEDFVRQGLVSKDGWQIHFNHLYVTLKSPKAYQLSVSGDMNTMIIPAHAYGVGLPETYTVDLAAGDTQALPLFLGDVTEARVGNYNGLTFGLGTAPAGPSEGNSIYLQGIAEKEGEKITFTFSISETLSYTCGGYVGERLKGILADGKEAEIEMTFHFDHLFGDATQAAESHVNTSALGFGFLARHAKVGCVVLADNDKNGLNDAERKHILAILPTLGHTGEGHCSCNR